MSTLKVFKDTDTNKYYMIVDSPLEEADGFIFAASPSVDGNENIYFPNENEIQTQNWYIIENPSNINYIFFKVTQYNGAEILSDNTTVEYYNIPVIEYVTNVVRTGNDSGYDNEYQQYFTNEDIVYILRNTNILNIKFSKRLENSQISENDRKFGSANNAVNSDDTGLGAAHEGAVIWYHTNNSSIVGTDSNTLYLKYNNEYVDSNSTPADTSDDIPIKYHFNYGGELINGNEISPNNKHILHIRTDNVGLQNILNVFGWRIGEREDDNDNMELYPINKQTSEKLISEWNPLIVKKTESGYSFVRNEEEIVSSITLRFKDTNGINYTNNPIKYYQIPIGDFQGRFTIEEIKQGSNNTSTSGADNIIHLSFYSEQNKTNEGQMKQTYWVDKVGDTGEIPAGSKYMDIVSDTATQIIIKFEI